MSVRAGILAVLTDSEAYGLQIHGELEERTDRHGLINVGQIYSTLDRLNAAGLVRASGTTADGLPLYALTDDGRREAGAWLSTADVGTPAAWADMVFKVLLATSLANDHGHRLVELYRRRWSELSQEGHQSRGETPEHPESPGSLARERLAAAALLWLDDLDGLPGGLASLQRPLRNERPRRGRRPATTPE